MKPSRDHFEKKVISLFLLIIVLLVAVTIAAVKNIQRSQAAVDWINQTQAVISEAANLLAALNVAEIDLRDFLLTGAERDLAAALSGYEKAREHLDLGKALTRRETDQLKEFQEIEVLIAGRVKLVQKTRDFWQQGGLAAARKVIAGDSGDIAEIRQRVEKIENKAMALLRERDKQSFLQAGNTRMAIYIGSGLNFFILLFSIYLIRDDIRSRRQAALLLSESSATLEAAVQNRTLELASANKKLAWDNLEQSWSNQALEHQLRYNQLILNSIDEPVFVISKASNISRVNSAATHWTGFKPQELVGKPLRTIFKINNSTESREPSLEDNIASHLNGGRDMVGARGVLRNSKGEETEVTFSVFPLRDSDKIVGGVVTIKTFKA